MAGHNYHQHSFVQSVPRMDSILKPGYMLRTSASRLKELVPIVAVGCSSLSCFRVQHPAACKTVRLMIVNWTAADPHLMFRVDADSVFGALPL